jgi:hypothetical protein
MSDKKQEQVERFEIDATSKVHCANQTCFNHDPDSCCCNLKVIPIDDRGKCAGVVKVAPKRKKAVSRKGAKTAKVKKTT